jgi:lipid II:glycine glycyltransferase (peptidoglycan interpeptide bridge formation enzyme)
VSLPFTDFSEPILSTNANENGIWNTLVDYGEKVGWKYLEIRGGNRFGQGRQPSSWYYNHTLGLATDTQKVFSSFRESNKRNIRKAGKVGVEVDFDDSLDSMREFYRLNCLTRRMHGLPPQPFTFFKNIHEHVILNRQGLLAIARYQGKAIASSLYFHFGRKVIYKYGASDNRYQHLRANNLVMWKAIEWYCQNGFDRFSFGRTDQEHNGLRQFKAGWGAKEGIVKYFQYNFTENDFVSTSSKVQGWHIDVFKKMPICFLKVAGRALYRHMG